jgi:hypothetical protein
MKRFVAPILAIVTSFFFTALPVLGQVQDGRIVGTVTDLNNSVVPNAKVAITSIKTNQVQTVTTNGAGDFVLTPVEPGGYNVVISAQGFGESQVQNVEVLVGQSARVDVALKIGDVTTKVEVTAAAPLLNTESGVLAQDVDNKQIVDLPLNGRNFYQLQSLTPGSTALPSSLNPGNASPVRPNNWNGTSVSGVNGMQTSFYLDGVDVTDHHRGGTLIQTSIDALQEFQVMQSGYTAEFPNAGGVINASTRSGGANFHGGLFEFLRNGAMDARNFFSLTPAGEKRNDFGGQIGGPLWLPHFRSKSSFFFLNYEGYREETEESFNNIVPTTAMRTGNFSAPGLNKIYDPTTGQPFPGNIIPASRLSPQAQFFSPYIPAPNSGTNHSIFSPNQGVNIDQFNVRLDQTINNNNRAFVRWSLDNFHEQSPNAFSALGNSPMRSQGDNVAAAWISTLRPTLINELRFSYLRDWVYEEAYLQNQDFYAQAGVTGFEQTGQRPASLGGKANNGSFPDFAWSGYTAMSGSNFDQRPKGDIISSWNWNDNMTWSKGTHIIKFGTQIRYWQPLLYDSGLYEGQWTFNGSITQNAASPAGTGDAFADYLLGLPYSVARAYPGETWGGQAWYDHFYIQDDYKASQRLTLNIGLRYEYSPWLSGYKGQVGTILPQSAQPIAVQSVNLNAQSVAPIAYSLFGPSGLNLIQTCANAKVAANCTGTDGTQFAPRVGLAWRPFGDTTVVRSGYGIFYEVESSGNRVNHNIVPYLLSETVYNTNATRNMSNYFLSQQLGRSGTTYPALQGGLPKMAMGYDQHWNFGVQQSLNRNTVLEVDYVGNRGVHQYGANPINDPLPGAGAIQGRRPLPLFGAVVYNGQNTSSIYNALQVKYERRPYAGLWYLVSYTYSNDIVTQITPAAGGDYTSQRALALFNIPQNLTISSGYELPLGRGQTFLANTNGVVNALVSGWQMQGILVLHSGLPFTPTISRDVSNTGIGSQLPNRLGSGVLSNPTISNWFNKAAFAVPATYTFGNSGSYILKGDRYKNLDFSFFKQFQLREQMSLEFRAEAFNLTNSPTFNPPSGTIDTATGSVVTSTLSTPRNIQLGLKFQF